MEYAGFWLRLIAGIIDVVLLIVMGVLLSLVYKYFLSEDIPDVIYFITLFIGLRFFYFAILLSSKWQATFGMKLLRLKIVTTDYERVSFITALWRELLTVLSQFLYIGYLMIACTSKKQGLHDKMVGTYVIKNH